MQIDCFPIKKSVEEAKREASRRGLVARLLSLRGRGEDIVMKTIYVENRLITFDIAMPPSFLAKFFSGSVQPRKSTIQMIANGSTCGVSYYDRRGVEIVRREVDDEAVQLSDYGDGQLITRGNALARRILRRRVGGRMLLEVAAIRSVFRPFHVAFFGEPIEGKKVYYIPIAADGCEVRRTF